MSYVEGGTVLGDDATQYTAHTSRRIFTRVPADAPGATHWVENASGTGGHMEAGSGELAAGGWRDQDGNVYTDDSKRAQEANDAVLDANAAHRADPTWGAVPSGPQYRDFTQTSTGTAPTLTVAQAAAAWLRTNTADATAYVESVAATNRGGFYDKPAAIYQWLLANLERETDAELHAAIVAQLGPAPTPQTPPAAPTTTTPPPAPTGPSATVNYPAATHSAAPSDAVVAVENRGMADEPTPAPSRKWWWIAGGVTAAAGLGLALAHSNSRSRRR